MNKELKLAYDVLKQIYVKGAYSSIELNSALQTSDAYNNGLVTKIVYGVLENDILLSYFLDQFYKKRPKPSIYVLLKIGAYCNKFLNSIPPFALVNELVNLAKQTDVSLAGFVNATLKNVIKTAITLPSEKDVVLHLSVKHSYPKWVVENLLKHNKLSFVKEFLEKDLTTLTHVRVNKSFVKPQDFEKMLIENNVHYEHSHIANCFFVDYEKLLKIDELKIYYIVMGASSVNLCNEVEPNEKAKILDVCASPGGKSLYFSQHYPLAQITSADVHSHRVELINKMVKTYNAKNITTIQNDGTKLRQEWVNKWDTVLCDVPCSGIGVAGKKPDILINRKAEDIKQLTELQHQILKISSNYVKVGGELVYSTCTIIKEENQGVVVRFLKQNPHFELQELKNPNNINYVKDGKMATVWPHINEMEGFFIAKLKRIR